MLKMNAINRPKSSHSFNLSDGANVAATSGVLRCRMLEMRFLPVLVFYIGRTSGVGQVLIGGFGYISIQVVYVGKLFRYHINGSNWRVLIKGTVINVQVDGNQDSQCYIIK